MVIVGGREMPIKINHVAETRDAHGPSAADAKADARLVVFTATPCVNIIGCGKLKLASTKPFDSHSSIQADRTICGKCPWAEYLAGKKILTAHGDLVGLAAIQARSIRHSQMVPCPPEKFCFADAGPSRVDLAQVFYHHNH